MLSNAYFLAKFRFDTAENEPAKNLQNFATFCNILLNLLILLTLTLTLTDPAPEVPGLRAGAHAPEGARHRGVARHAGVLSPRQPAEKHREDLAKV